MAEIDIIIKANQDELQFSEESLPAWINLGQNGDEAPEDRHQATVHRFNLDEFNTNSTNFSR